MSSSAWNDLERTVARRLRGRRKLRGGAFSMKDLDVEVPDNPQLRICIDATYRSGNPAHHTLLSEARRKYCQEDGSVALLATKELREQCEVVCRLYPNDFAELLEALRASEEER